MPRATSNPRGFVHPELAGFLVLFAMAAAFSLPLIERMELSLLWLPLFVIAIAGGIFLLIVSCGMLVVCVSDALAKRRRERK